MKTFIIIFRVFLIFLIIFGCSYLVDTNPELFGDVRCGKFNDMSLNIFHSNHTEIEYHYCFNHVLLICFEILISFIQIGTLLEYINENY